jgi:hypothetical protein
MRRASAGGGGGYLDSSNTESINHPSIGGAGNYARFLNRAMAAGGVSGSSPAQNAYIANAIVPVALNQTGGLKELAPDDSAVQEIIKRSSDLRAAAGYGAV